MKNILLTGGSGFIGGNIKYILSEEYNIISPSRNDLNLLDIEQVKSFLHKYKIDLIIHCANPTPSKNDIDKLDTILQDSLHIYFNLRSCCNLYEKMLYIGSGAEFDKRFDIVNTTEDEFGNSIPIDDYGFAKYIMNLDARASTNIYNLRVFGCYGKGDARGKFIRDMLDYVLEDQDLTIRQDCKFDYIFVEDLAHIIIKLLNTSLLYHDYNITTGRSSSLLEIAKTVIKVTNTNYSINLLKAGLNNEYTASNERLIKQIGVYKFTTLEEGIRKQFEWQRSLRCERL